MSIGNPRPGETRFSQKVTSPAPGGRKRKKSRVLARKAAAKRKAQKARALKKPSQSLGLGGIFRRINKALE